MCKYAKTSDLLLFIILSGWCKKKLIIWSKPLRSIEKQILGQVIVTVICFSYFNISPKFVHKWRPKMKTHGASKRCNLWISIWFGPYRLVNYYSCTNLAVVRLVQRTSSIDLLFLSRQNATGRRSFTFPHFFLRLVTTIDRSFCFIAKF